MKQVTAPFIGQILKNKLSNGQVVVVEVLQLAVAGSNMPRVCDVRENIYPLGYMIQKNLTWACPIENLFVDEETKALTEKAFEPMSHKHALAHYKF